MKTIEAEPHKPSFWQLVFSRSIVNGAPYTGEQLSRHLWDWPKDTFLQRRLHELQWLHGTDAAEAKVNARPDAGPKGRRYRPM